MSPLTSRKRRRKAKTVAAGKPRRHRLKLPGAPGSDDGIDLSSMSPAMVDRLFWRAGFGPTPAARATWARPPGSEAGTCRPLSRGHRRDARHP